jgi:hypothetical protein
MRGSWDSKGNADDSGDEDAGAADSKGVRPGSERDSVAWTGSAAMAGTFAMGEEY